MHYGAAIEQVLKVRYRGVVIELWHDISEKISTGRAHGWAVLRGRPLVVSMSAPSPRTRAAS